MKFFTILIWLVAALVATSAYAESRYVIDDLTITLRSGRSNQHNILKLLHSGARVEILEEVVDNDRAYSRVKVDDIEGWVLSQYLVAEPIARDRLAAAESRLQQYREDNQRLQQQLRQANTELATLRKQRDKLESDIDKAGKDLEQLKQVASNPIQTARQNNELRSELAQLKTDHELLLQQHALLKNNNQRDWFVVGAAVVIISMLFGIILTRIRWRRRNGWGDL